MREPPSPLLDCFACSGPQLPLRGSAVRPELPVVQLSPLESCVERATATRLWPKESRCGSPSGCSLRAVSIHTPLGAGVIPFVRSSSRACARRVLADRPSQQRRPPAQRHLPSGGSNSRCTWPAAAKRGPCAPRRPVVPSQTIIAPGRNPGARRTHWSFAGRRPAGLRSPRCERLEPLAREDRTSLARIVGDEAKREMTGTPVLECGTEVVRAHQQAQRVPI